MINSLYWWKDEPNFGDEASSYIVTRLCGRELPWSKPQINILKEIYKKIKSQIKRKVYKIDLEGYVYPWQKTLFCVGSLLEQSNYKTIVWGSGFREYKSKCNRGRYIAVRGNLSEAKVLKRYPKLKLAIGDPALLLPLLYQPTISHKHDVGIIPHFVDFDFFNRYSKKYHIIDVRTTNVEHVIDEILSCRLILSSSLHGLIIAHAYGIPALWIRHGFVNSSDFKYHDYFSSVKISDYSGFCNCDELLDNYNMIVQLFKSNKDKHSIQLDLHKLQLNLINSFPEKSDEVIKIINRLNK